MYREEEVAPHTHGKLLFLNELLLLINRVRRHTNNLHLSPLEQILLYGL